MCTTCKQCLRRPVRVSDPLELELQEVVSYVIRVLGTMLCLLKEQVILPLSHLSTTTQIVFFFFNRYFVPVTKNSNGFQWQHQTCCREVWKHLNFLEAVVDFYFFVKYLHVSHCLCFHTILTSSYISVERTETQTSKVTSNTDVTRHVIYYLCFVIFHLFT